MRWQLLISMAAGWLLASSAWADSDPLEEFNHGLMLGGPAGFEEALVLSTDVDAQVSGIIARVSLKQEFENTSPDYREGIYVFPLPDGAAVDQMRITIGERVIEGEIQEKEEAKKVYEQARREGRKASLVEQDRPNLFRTSVANIAPGERVTVEIAWLEEIRFDDGRFAWRFPLTLTPRYNPESAIVTRAAYANPPFRQASRGHRVSLNLHINAGMPLDIIASRYHPVTVDSTGHRYQVALTDGSALMNHDFELLWRPEPAAVPRAASFSEVVDGELHHLLMVLPPSEGLPSAPRMPRETIFIIDTSGSMHGNSLQQAREALLVALDTLQPGDLFNIVEFNSVTRPVFRTSVEVTGTNLATAEQAISNFTANGGTDMAPALGFALRSAPSTLHVRQVIFVTDGAVGNEEMLFRQIRHQLGDARLFTVGIGSAPNSWFMRKAAEIGRGRATLIASSTELGEKMSALFRKIDSPQLTDIELHGVGAAEIYPTTVPDLHAGEPVVIRTRGLNAQSIAVSGKAPTGHWRMDVPVDRDLTGFGTGALWARARLQDLSDRQRRGGDHESLRLDAIDTALSYHLVSRYTSLVAVDRTPELTAAVNLKRTRVPSLIPAGSTVGFPATATPAELYRMVGIAICLFGFALLWRQRVARHARVS